MPPRTALASLGKHCQAYATTPYAQITTTSRVAALKEVRSAAISVLSLDSDDSSAPRRGAIDALKGIVADSGSRWNDGAKRRKVTNLEKLRLGKANEEYLRQMPRRWKVGEVYAPHDLSSTEASKWRKHTNRKQDVVDMLGINPLDWYRNFSMISEFMSSTGRIMHSESTGLRPVNQRKMAKAIRRAIGLGIHPSIHRHPMFLLHQSPYIKVPTTPSKKE